MAVHTHNATHSKALKRTAVTLTAASLGMFALDYCLWGDLHTNYPKNGLLIATAVFWLLWSNATKQGHIEDKVEHATSEIRSEVVLTALEDRVQR